MALTHLEEPAATDDARSPVDAAMGVVASAERVTISELRDGGIGFDVEPDPKTAWKPAIVCILVGVFAIPAGYLLHVHNSGLPDGYRWPGTSMIMALGAISVALGLLLLLIFVMNGPPKKASIEARPGSLRADRFIGGDHVVSNYTAAEVQCLFVEASQLFATIRKGDQQLIAFGDRDVNIAIATLLASRLWHPEAVVGGAAHRLDRWVLVPRSRLEPVANGGRS